MSMNIRRMALAALAALMTAGGSVAAATTGSASHLQPAAAHVVKTLGGEIFKPNLSVTVTLRFAPGSLRVRSGDTVVFDHADMGRDPHTVSWSPPRTSRATPSRAPRATESNRRTSRMGRASRRRSSMSAALDWISLVTRSSG
jgi:plastocyanin